MQVFNTFFKICKKKSASIVLYLGIFGAIVVLMTLTSEDNINSNFEMKSLNITVMDEDDSELSRSLISYLDSMHQLVDLPDDREVIQDNLYYRYVDYVLTIPKGFEENFLEKDELLKNVKVPGTARGQFIDKQIAAYLNTVNLYLAGGDTMEEAIKKTDTDISKMSEVKVVSFKDTEMESKPYLYVMFHYLPYVIMATIISGLAPILVEMNSKEIKNRTACSSTPLSKQTFWLTAATIVFCLIIWGLYMILAAIVFHKEFFAVETLYGMMNSFLLLLYSAAITLFVSTFAPNGNVTNMVSNVVALSMSFLCGVFVPQSMLADSVVKASKFLPVYWYIRANDMMGGLIDVNIDIGVYWKCIGVQALFVIAIAVAALVSVRYHRQKA